MMINNLHLIEEAGKRQGLTGRKLKGFVKKRLRQIIKKLKKDGII